MLKKVAAASLIAMAATGPAWAADDDQMIGLIVSGVVDNWNGVQFLDVDGFGSDTLMSSGVSGRVSLPLGQNFSIQSDALGEYNDYAYDGRGSPGPSFSFQGAVHASYRNPSQFLFGVFGGAGDAHNRSFGRTLSEDYAFVGGEAQIYLNNVTLYGQGGYLDFDSLRRRGNTDDKGLFGRGVLRWFLDADSRIQLEGTYANIERRRSGDRDVWQLGARYDTTLHGVPFFDTMPVYIGYRGTFRNDCVRGGNMNDHTVMIGTSYSFSGSILNVDRNGATTDTPNFATFTGCGGRGGGGGGGGGGGLIP